MEINDIAESVLRGNTIFGEPWKSCHIITLDQGGVGGRWQAFLNIQNMYNVLVETPDTVNIESLKAFVYGRLAPKIKEYI